MNAICCPDHETLQAYLLGQVDDDAIETHLDSCAGCQAALDEMDAVVNRPFACLREPAGALTPSPSPGGRGETWDWQQPTFQHLVAQAKDIVARPNGVARENQVFGNYLLLQLLGAGGFGRVYKAWHQRLKKWVVVKLLGPAHAQSPDSRGRFLREMEAVGRLSSPNIVAAHDAGEIDGQLFLVMELVEGKDLGRLVKEEGPMPVARALDYVLQAARGLDDAHAAGIIHRDVKPSNLMLDAAGTVKVLDLGLARFLCEGDAPTDGAVAGTLAFMAPELHTPGQHGDARSDIYSLGCTLYNLVTGRAPYEAENNRDILAGHRDGAIPSIGASRGVDALFRRMVAKNPADRPASMKAVIAELQRLTAHRPPRRVIGWGSLIAASVLVVGSALLAFAYWLPSGEQPKDGKKVEAKLTMPKKGATPEIDMVKIEPGEFWMGSSDADPRAKKAETPRKKIRINRPFFLGKTEVTQAQYEEVIGSNPSAFSAKGANKARVKDLDTGKHPVESVSWLDAVRFCNRLSERHELPPYYKIKDDVVTIRGGPGYRLPTEAEWEYACRAGTTTTWSFGEKANDLKDHAWFADNSDDRTHPVGQKKANPWGLFDMYGNVPEWCWDRFDPEYYAYMPRSDPPGSGEGRLRTIRGDGWNATLPRTAARPALGFAYGGAGSINVVGFRVARNAE